MNAREDAIDAREVQERLLDRIAEESAKAEPAWLGVLVQAYTAVSIEVAREPE